MKKNSAATKMIAIASGGGHWVQLSRLSPFTDQFDTHFISTLKGLDSLHNLKLYTQINDCNRNELIQIIKTTISLFILLIKIRPKIIISTGALPGLICILLGKYIFRSKTIWLDSVANGWELSMSGKIARKNCDLFLTQWPELANDQEVKYMGSVI